MLLSSIAFMMPYCTPMSTTANPIPEVKSANRTQSWARFRQARGTGFGLCMGRESGGRSQGRESGVGRDQEGRRYSPCPRRMFLLPPGS